MLRAGLILAEARQCNQRLREEREDPMPEKTKTTVVIESHEQTIIRRSWRTIRSGEFPIAAELEALARPLGRAPAEKIEPAVQEKRNSLAACVKTVAMKSAFWLRRLNARAFERRTRQL